MTIETCEPEIFEGPAGWLATTPPAHSHRIGVVGATREEARRRFLLAMEAWRQLDERVEAERRLARA